jgi:hypothetical protein
MEVTVYLLIFIAAFVGIVVWYSVASAKRVLRRMLKSLSRMERVERLDAGCWPGVTMIHERTYIIHNPGP